MHPAGCASHAPCRLSKIGCSTQARAVGPKRRAATSLQRDTGTRPSAHNWLRLACVPGIPLSQCPRPHVVQSLEGLGAYQYGCTHPVHINGCARIRAHQWVCTHPMHSNMAACLPCVPTAVCNLVHTNGCVCLPCAPKAVCNPALINECAQFRAHQRLLRRSTQGGVPEEQRVRLANVMALGAVQLFVGDIQSGAVLFKPMWRTLCYEVGGLCLWACGRALVVHVRVDARGQHTRKKRMGCMAWRFAGIWCMGCAWRWGGGGSQGGGWCA